MLNPPENSKIQGLFKAFECFSSAFQGKFNFSRTFHNSPVYSSSFQACENPGITVSNFTEVFIGLQRVKPPVFQDAG